MNSYDRKIKRKAYVHAQRLIVNALSDGYRSAIPRALSTLDIAIAAMDCEFCDGNGCEECVDGPATMSEVKYNRQ